MLQNAYWLAKIGADTAENERNFAENLLKFAGPRSQAAFCAASSAAASARARSAAARAAAASTSFQNRRWDFCKICKFLAGSFSAVSKQNFARKLRLTAFFKLYKICILLYRCNLKILAKNRFEKQEFSWKFSKHFANVAKFAKYCKNSKFSAG